ncbi:hypothetical protein C8F04DRAFT_557313 [Mycena alexandri]|uniref:Uncharacterized protein n=1 Tax=Mycena alexandri TaxID=1745969 RepID=A0AAD6WM36_9AGAR|nr:hypothetical protein C8F04DRAFT_557313 [Mycena alexandri]
MQIRGGPERLPPRNYAPRLVRSASLRRSPTCSRSLRNSPFMASVSSIRRRLRVPAPVPRAGPVSKISLISILAAVWSFRRSLRNGANSFLDVLLAPSRAAHLESSYSTPPTSHPPRPCLRIPPCRHMVGYEVVVHLHYRRVPTHHYIAPRYPRAGFAPPLHRRSGRLPRVTWSAAIYIVVRLGQKSAGATLSASSQSPGIARTSFPPRNLALVPRQVRARRCTATTNLRPK